MNKNNNNNNKIKKKKIIKQKKKEQERIEEARNQVKLQALKDREAEAKKIAEQKKQWEDEIQERKKRQEEVRTILTYHYSPSLSFFKCKTILIIQN